MTLWALALATSCSSRATETVLFDLDDTIFDHSLTCREAIDRLRNEEPYLRRRPLDDLWHDYLALLNRPSPGDLRFSSVETMREERWRQVAATCGMALEPAEVTALSRQYRAYYQAARRAVPGAVEMVTALHEGGVRIAIVTNNEVAEQEEKLRFLGLAGTVDALVVSEAVGASKPDPRIFSVALERTHSVPEGCVMVGDSWPNDVVGALGVGIRPVWFNRFIEPPPEASSVAELRSFVPRGAAERLIRDAPAPVLRPGPS